MEEETVPVICTVAGPRQPFSAEIYNGAELRATSLRPGAYNAFALPSLFNGRRRPSVQAALAGSSVHTSRHAEGQLAAVHETIANLDRYKSAGVAAEALVKVLAKANKPARVPKPPRPPAAPRVKPPYLPREGSVPSLLLAHLQAHGGHMTYSEVARRFGIPPSSTTAIFKTALEAGVVVRVVAEGRAALALPGYVAPPAAPRPSKELLAQQARLERTRARVAKLERELLELQGLAPSQAPLSHHESTP